MAFAQGERLQAPCHSSSGPVLILYFPLFALTCASVVILRRSRPGIARSLYRGALGLAVLPYLLHVHYTWGWVTRFGDPTPPIGAYPGVRAYATSSLTAAVLLLATGWFLVGRIPLVTVLVPAILWLVYWYICLPLVFRGAPEFAPLDNVPLVWLFASSAFATVLLAGTAWAALRRNPPA